MKNKTIFLDRRFVKANHRFIESLSPGLVLGQGVFETMRVYQGKLFAFEHHYDRLLRGLNILNLKMPISKRKVNSYIDRLLKLNTLKNARVRLAVWKNDNRLRISIVCQTWKSIAENKYKHGVRAIVSSRIRKRTRWSHIKSLDYKLFREAFLEAKNQGCQEAILLNPRNELVEGSNTNIFFVKNRTLYTPAVKCGCLNGITRQIVLEFARKMTIPCHIGALTLKQILFSDEAFLTNSLIEVMPLTRLNGFLIGKGKIGPITSEIRKCYQELVSNTYQNNF